MSRKRGFTLVELLIVVIILGILASVVIPQFSTAASDANSAAVMADLQTIRSQLQLYAAQHGGAYPTTTTQLLEYTDAVGGVSATFSTTDMFGPYMLTIPANPYSGINTVRIVTDGTPFSGADNTKGWWYSTTTGQFLCDVADTVVTTNGAQVNGL